MSDGGTKAAKAIAHTVALEGALAQADFFITQLHAYSLHPDGIDALTTLSDNIKEMCRVAELLENSFYKVIGEGG